MSNFIQLKVDFLNFCYMFFGNQISLEESAICETDGILERIAVIDIDFLILLIDRINHNETISTEFVPQFSDKEAIDRVVSIFVESGEKAITYRDLGYYLKRDNNMLPAAKAKYGENHGKGAALLGLAVYEPGIVSPSVFTQQYYEIPSIIDRMKLQNILMMRIPLIQNLLFNSKNSVYNGYDSMKIFKKSTMIRRGQSARMILHELESLNNDILSRRVHNIFWNAESIDFST